MKKSLLLLSFAACASMVSAQTVIGLVTAEDAAAAGLAKDKAAIAGGTVLLDNEAGSFALAYDDSWGTSSAGKTYKTVKVGESEPIKLSDFSGAVGNANPTFVSYQSGVMSAGAVFLIEAKKDGWMTVFTNINPNKQYLIFEGKTGALPYTLGVAGADYKINYSLPAHTSGDDEGYIDFGAQDASKYFIAATEQVKNAEGLKLWKDADGNEVWAESKPDGGSAVMVDIEPRQDKPEFPWKVAGLDKAPGEGTGFLTFNVLKGNSYYFSGLGTKCVGAGFVFTDSEEEPAVTYLAQDELPEVVFATAAAVEGIQAVDNNDENAPIYNVMGVRVNADAKGILIQNGKKFIRK